MSKKGVLIVNLGTPDSPSVKDVRRYLDEFLSDPRVIDVNPALRYFLVKGIIVPFRGPKSAALYRKIWTEEGSPLMVYGLRVQKLLAERLGEGYHVALAMRYQNPSIESALEELRAQFVSSIKVIPLFPQYASATNGSVIQKVMELVSNWQAIPELEFVSSFHDDQEMIQAFAEIGRTYNPASYDHVLFSFHGLPERQLLKADPTGCHCLKKADCCSRLIDANRNCYSAQSHDTARLIAENLGISPSDYTVCFQSRLGKEPWRKPYTSEVIHELAARGMKRLLVFCPAFVCDCLETIYEVSVEYHEEFRKAGGEHIQLVEGLNTHRLWIEALAGLAVK